MKIFNRLNLFAAAIALVFAGATMAQQSAEDFAPPAEETIDVSDQQLEQFADAQVEIGSIQEDYSARLMETEDPEKARELQQEAQDEMTTAVEDAGLDVETFNSIAMAIQSSPELQQKLSTLLENQ